MARPATPLASGDGNLCETEKRAVSQRRLFVCRIAPSGSGWDPSGRELCRFPGCSVVANPPEMRCRVPSLRGRQRQCLRCGRCKAAGRLINLEALAKCCWFLFAQTGTFDWMSALYSVQMQETQCVMRDA